MWIQDFNKLMPETIDYRNSQYTTWLARSANTQKALHAQCNLKSTCAAHSRSYCYMMAHKTFPNLVMVTRCAPTNPFDAEGRVVIQRVPESQKFTHFCEINNLEITSRICDRCNLFNCRWS